jgi:tetratricopeptide (TPR) repeat protein
MRSLIFKLLFVLATVGLSAERVSAIPSPAEANIFRKNSKAETDTSSLNRYIRESFSHIKKIDQFSMWSKSNDEEVQFLKSYIDSAELVCVDKNIEFPASLHLARAIYFFFTNDFTSASQEGTLAMQKSKSNGEVEILAKTMNFMGTYCWRTKFYMESISYFENAISIAEKNKLKGIIPKSYLNLKNVYDYLGNLKEHRSNTVKLIEAAEKEHDTLFLELGLESLGKSYVEQDRNFKLADSLLKKCIEVAMIRKDTDFIVWPMTDNGFNLYLEKQYDAAIKCYNQSLAYSLPAKNYIGSANALGNLGTIYRDIGETEKSLKYYLESIQQAKAINYIFHLSWVYKDMSDMYLIRRDTSNAYKNYVLFKQYSDSLLKKTSSEGLMDARIRYEADSHNKAMELLNLRLYNQRLLIYGAVGLFVLSVTVLILLLSRAKINAKRHISEMSRKISEITQANLRQQMNPHFIFNTLNSIQYYMYQHDKLATNNYLTKFSSLMRKVLENSQYTSVPLRDELDALNLYLELEMIRFKDKFEYEINIDDEIDTLLYKVPTMLIQPYVENSISHGLMPNENKGHVKIDLKLEHEYILCTIEDNGIGREAALEKKKKSDGNHNSLGTQIVSSRLDLVNSLYGTTLKTTYTDLRNENGEASGTRVEIQIPILS